MKSDVIKFFDDLKFRLNLFQGFKKYTDKYLASKFNVFDYIYQDENRLSDIIADLLDPNGKHGQEEVFLREFLNLILNRVEKSIAGYDLRKARISREKTTNYLIRSQRRIDITINLGTFGIGIENKPWAGDQEHQLRDYNENLNRQFKGNYLLIYLSGFGAEPQSLNQNEKENLKEQKKLLVICYPIEFKEWLQNCYKECNSEKIRYFLRDFIDFVDGKFNIISNKEE